MFAVLYLGGFFALGAYGFGLQPAAIFAVIAALLGSAVHWSYRLRHALELQSSLVVGALAVFGFLTATVLYLAMWWLGAWSFGRF